MKQIKDIYRYFPCPGSDALVVYFSAASDTRLDGIRLLRKFKVNKLFVRDPGRTWYNGQIPQLSTDADHLAAVLDEVVSKFDRDKVTFMGSSMGGYGALLFGSLLQVGRIRVAGPQVVLDPKVPRSPKIPVKYADLTDVIRQSTSDIKIWFGCGELLDAYQVMRCSLLPGCTVYAVPKALHNVLAHFKSEGVLSGFFDFAILDVPFEYDYGVLTDLQLAKIQSAMDSLYFDADVAKSTKILRQVKGGLVDSALNCQIGENLLKLSQVKSAIEHLLRAVEANAGNYEALALLGSTYVAERDYANAVTFYERAITSFPGKNVDYVTQLAGAYRLNRDFSRALSTLAQAHEIAEYPKTHYYAGLTYRDMERFQDAIRSFQAVLALRPDFSPAMAQIRHCLAQYVVNEAKERFGLNVRAEIDICDASPERFQ